MVTYFKERFWEVCWENKSLISERKIHFGIEIYNDWNNKCDPRGFATSTFDLPLLQNCILAILALQKTNLLIYFAKYR